MRYSKRMLLLPLLLVGGMTTAVAEEIRIGIGHQSMCTDTYSAGIIVKELGLIDKYLPKEGKYADASYSYDWKDYTSGPPITNMMLANKLDFGVMGDYPLIVNGAKFQESDSQRSVYIAGTGYNLRGSGNAIVVPVDSEIYSFSDLKGKTLSVPVGSAAWGMTLKAMQDAGMSASDVTIKNQSPPVGAANIAAGRIDAHADFCPWSEIMEFRGTGRKVYNGSETNVPYLHGVVVRKDYAEQYPEVVVAYLKAVIEAGQWVEEDPIRAAESLEKWTGIEKEVQYLYFSPGGHLTLDATIKPEWVDALAYDHEVLSKHGKAPPLDVDAWIDDSYIRQAYDEMGLDYEAQVAQINKPKRTNTQLPPGEIWHARDGLTRYDSVAAMLEAAAAFKEKGQKVNATYVYDRETGLKLFGKVAYYVKAGDDYVAFMRKSDADAYARNAGASVVTFEDALGGFSEQIAAEQAPAGDAVAAN